MKDKYCAVLDELVSNINGAYKGMFTDLAEYAVNLGYHPVRNKTNDITIDFRNNRLKKTIMKMEVKEQKHDGYKYGQRDVPGLRIKFFASHEFSDIFKLGIQRVIEDFGGKYTGCYGCGRCDGTEGYTFIYPDGRTVFRCGSELISIFNFSENDIPEIKKLLKLQNDYYIKSIGNS